MARQLRYFVVRTTGMLGGLRLLPVTAARVNREEHVIELLADDEELQHTYCFNPRHFPSFSDEDVLNAIFAPQR